VELRSVAEEMAVAIPSAARSADLPSIGAQQSCTAANQL
jgi:hypothetical protein